VATPTAAGQSGWHLAINVTAQPTPIIVALVESSRRLADPQSVLAAGTRIPCATALHKISGSGQLLVMQQIDANGLCEVLGYV